MKNAVPTLRGSAFAAITFFAVAALLGGCATTRDGSWRGIDVPEGVGLVSISYPAVAQLDPAGPVYPFDRTKEPHASPTTFGGLVAWCGATVSDPKTKKLTGFVYDAVFLGEYHGNPVSHGMELAMLRALFDAKHGMVALSMEQFERDCQRVLSQYLAGEITEEAFLAASRPWPNYAKDYRPLIEFCKENKIPVLAANVPRRIASGVSKSGMASLDALDVRERSWAAARVSDQDGAYKDKFFALMGSKREDFFRAQAIKDDTMAESIATFADQNPGRLILHINGDFHSRERLGTVERLIARRPAMGVAVISPLMVEPGAETEILWWAQNGREPNCFDMTSQASSQRRDPWPHGYPPALKQYLGDGDFLYVMKAPPKEPEKPAPAAPNPHQPNPHKPADPAPPAQK